jgi:two-component system response regulator HydG
MTRLLEMARRIAQTEANVLLCGESGTGKGMLARFMHDCSPRHAGPFRAVACGDLSAEILERTLFGGGEGSDGASIGRIEEAQGGTILIDGIGAMPPAVQGRLMRVVQEGTVERSAGTRAVEVDVRILSATDVDLSPLVGAGQFRKDLYYRLNAIRVDLPPLRERMEDLPALAEEGLDAIAARPGGRPRRLSPGALRRLQAHDWPGNVRELNNVLEAAALFDESPEIPAAAIRIDAARESGPIGEATRRRASLAQLEQQYIREILRLTGDNRTQAARILGINRKTLLEKRKRYGIR